MNAAVAWRNLCNDHHVWDGKIQRKADTSLCYKRNDWTAMKITRYSYMKSQGNALTGLNNCDKDTLCIKFQKGDSCLAGKQQYEPSLFTDSFQLSIGKSENPKQIYPDRKGVGWSFSLEQHSDSSPLFWDVFKYSVLQWGTTGLSSLKVQNHF